MAKSSLRKSTVAGRKKHKRGTMARKSFNLERESYVGEDGWHPHLRKHQKIEEEEEEIDEKKSTGRVKMTGMSVVNVCEEEAQERGKSLYMCSFELEQIDETDDGLCTGAYVVRTVDLSDLYSDSDDSLELREVGYRGGEDLPHNCGCGVLGSRFIFAGGLIASSTTYGLEGSTQAFAFDVNDPKHVIVDLDGRLQEPKNLPLMVELCGKLYVLSGVRCGRMNESFEVYDPIQRSWSLLPQFPTSGRGYASACAVSGTKFFVSIGSSPVFCLDLANPTQWRPVPSMCSGGPFPFDGKALLLNNKIMFTSKTTYHDTKLVVYLLSLDESLETITPVHELNLPPELPPGKPSSCHFLHLGDDNVCLIIPTFILPDHPRIDDHGDSPRTHLIQGAVIPFRFQFDVSKDIANCFAVQFQPPRILEYHTRPCTDPQPHTLGCFVL